MAYFNFFSQMWDKPLLLLVSNGFNLRALPWMSFLPSWKVHSDLNRGKWGLQFWVLLWPPGWVVGALFWYLVGLPLLERFTTVPSFLHFWIMSLTVVCWSLKARNESVTLSRLRDVINFVSQMFLSLMAGHLHRTRMYCFVKLNSGFP